MTQMNLKAVKGIQIMKFRELNMEHEGRNLKGDFQGSSTSESVGGGTIIKSERQRGYRPASHSTKLYGKNSWPPICKDFFPYLSQWAYFFPSNHTDFYHIPECFLWSSILNRNGMGNKVYI